MRQALSILVVSVLLLEPPILARAANQPTSRPQVSSPEIARTKERILQIPAQSYVEVRLRDERKLRGQLGEVTDQGFALQIAQADRIQTVKLSFDDVKSVKVPEHKANAVGKAVAYGLAGIGVFFVTLLIICAAGTCGG